MKYYKLLKDLPFVKAGEILGIYHSDDKKYLHIFDENRDEIYKLKVGYNVAKMYSEWFKEEPKIYFTIDFFRKEIAKVSEKEIMGYAINNVKSLGLLFETREEAEKHLEYLKAKTIIKQDAKGFKPNWADEEQNKYSGCWQWLTTKLDYTWDRTYKSSTIYFETEKEIKESFEKHPEEWKTYLTYEQ